MFLTSLPDNKESHKHLCVGKDYEILKTAGNGYVIAGENGDTFLILQDRFVEIYEAAEAGPRV